MIIYKATNKINGKCYIGQTIQTLDNRIRGHKSEKKNTAFKRAINKYSIDGFNWKILYECSTQEELNKQEIYYINLYDTFKSSNGYNSAPGGNCGAYPGKGRNHWMNKMSERELIKWKEENLIGKNHSHKKNKTEIKYEQWLYENIRGENHPNFGIKWSEEQKEIRSKMYRGKKNPNYGNKWTDEQRKNMSNKVSGQKNPNYGKKPHNIKEYIITTPKGKDIKIRGLKKWCREQPQPFFSSVFFSILAGKGKYYKKYTIRRLEQ